MNKNIILYTLLVFVLLLSACGQTPTPLPTSTEIVLPTLPPTTTSTPTLVPTPTSTAEPVWYQQLDLSYSELKYRYGLVRDPRAKIYVSLEDAVAGNGNYGSLQSTPAYIVINGEQTRDGKIYYANLLGWISATDIQLVAPSTFRGILLTKAVDFRFAWVLDETHSVNAAGTPLRTYSRYEVVHEVQPVTENPGYFAIGPDEWLPLNSLAITSPQVPPDAGLGVCRFIYVDLTTQTLRVYDNCKLVFATLVSTGQNPIWTYAGRFFIQYKVEYKELLPPSYSTSEYYLQGVPFFMGYSGDWGIHGVYWHDDFGRPVSHGCVNLSPADAKWMYAWTHEGENVILVRPDTP